MKDNVKEMLEGLSYDELLEVATEVTNLKKGAKADAKLEIADAQAETVDKVNSLINTGDLKIGSVINVQYKNTVVQATVKTIPTEKAKNLRLASESFDGEKKERYAEKFRFVSLA